MEQHNLIATSDYLGYPSPYWFLILFKVLGFILHIIPMHLVYGGILFSTILITFRNTYSVKTGCRMIKRMPIFIAYTINFGIVPLLFLQVIYYRVFYSATILMAWLWLSIIGLVLIGYIFTYYLSSKINEENQTFTIFQTIISYLTSFCFVIVGFLFTTGYSLMVHVNEWHNIWKSNNVGGAVTGLYLYSNFKHTLSRWLMMFSLSFTTIAIYLLIDTVFFLQNGDNKFKEWINKLSLKLYAFGTLGYWVIGAWYLFGATLPLLKPETISKNLYLLMGITALSPIIPLILILQKHQNITKSNTILIAAMQLIVIALNAISRQVIQNLQLLPFLDVTKEKVSPQINIMLIFLITFVTGIGIIVYMIKQIINVKGEQVN
jgi:hypothetical protein